jgi:hypothetical protein
MTFLRSYGFSALTQNFLVGVFAIQWGILTTGFFDDIFTSGAEKIPINVGQVQNTTEQFRFLFNALLLLLFFVLKK